MWREAINSSVSSALIDTVWTEDGKINKGNSVRAGLQAAATFLMLNNNRFSTKCVGNIRIGIGGRASERAGIKTNYTHPVRVNILVLLILPCSS